MQFKENLDVIEEDIAQYSRELLDILLKDRTTNENIIWATSDYISHGELYLGALENPTKSCAKPNEVRNV